MTDFTPHMRDHAIEEATISVRFWAPTAEDAFKSALDVARDVAGAQNLPGRVQVPVMPQLFGRSQITLPFGSNQLPMASVFQRVQENGVIAEELTVDQSGAAYRTRSYRRWADVQKLIQSAFIPIIREMLSPDGMGIAIVELRCLDKFMASPVPDRVDYRQVLRADSEIVPPYALTLDGLWHSHVGWFEDVTECNRTLINLNIDVLDQPAEDGASTRSLSINQVISYQTNTLNISEADHIPENLAAIFDRIHKRDKELLGLLLSDQMQKKIGLWSQGEKL